MAARLGTDQQFHAALVADDALGAIVRGQIHIEARVNLVVAAYIARPDALPRLRFEQLIRLAVALGMSEELQSPLVALGHLRNQFAHRLDVALTEQMVTTLEASFSEAQKAMIREALAMTNRQHPQAALPAWEQCDAKSKFILMAHALDRLLLLAEQEAIRSRAAV